MSYRYFAIKPEALETLQVIMSEKKERRADMMPGQSVSQKTVHAVVGSIGLLNISGALWKSEDDAMWYGGTSYEMLNSALTQLESDPAVRAIVMMMDSPGGEVSGTGEFAARIAASQKTVVACVEGMACSAAYWIASQSDFLVMSETSEVGSIGVVATYMDAKGFFESKGIKIYQVVSSQSPMKRPDLASDEGMAEVRKTIDALAEIFVGKVSEGRNVSRETVLSDFGRGGVLVGIDAIKRKMADGVMGLREALGLMASGPAPSGPVAVENVAADVQPVAPAVAVVEPAPAAPGVAQDPKSSVDAGVKSERERIQAIEDLEIKGYDALIAEAKFKTGVDAASVLLAVNAEEKKRRAALQSNIIADAAELPADMRSVGSETASEIDDVTEGLIQAARAVSGKSAGGN